MTAVPLVLAPSALLPPTATVPRAVHPPPVAPWWALANLGSGSTAHGTPSGKTATIGSRAAHWPASALRGANGRSPCAGAMRGPVAASRKAAPPAQDLSAMILQKAAVRAQRYPHLIIDPFFLAAFSRIYSQLQGPHRNMESIGRRRHVAGMLLQNTGDLGLAEVGSLAQVRV